MGCVEIVENRALRCYQSGYESSNQDSHSERARIRRPNATSANGEWRKIPGTQKSRLRTSAHFTGVQLPENVDYIITMAVLAEATTKPSS